MFGNKSVRFIRASLIGYTLVARWPSFFRDYFKFLQNICTRPAWRKIPSSTYATTLRKRSFRIFCKFFNRCCTCRCLYLAAVCAVVESSGFQNRTPDRRSATLRVRGRWGMGMRRARVSFACLFYINRPDLMRMRSTVL